MRKLSEILYEPLFKGTKNKLLKKVMVLEFVTKRGKDIDVVYTHRIDTSLSAESHFENLGNGLITVAKKIRESDSERQLKA